MTASVSSEPRGSKTSRGRRRVLLVAAGAGGLVLLLAVVVAPRPVAERAAEAWLRDHGAPSRVEVLELTPGRLVARVRIGPAGHPDLSIERLEVDYRTAGPWSGRTFAVTPLRVRLDRPVLNLAWRHGRPEFGSLSGIVRWAEALPPSREPLPPIEIRRGRAILALDGGGVVLDGDGRLTPDAADFAARLAPFRLMVGQVSAKGTGGRIVVRRTGASTHLFGELGASDLAVQAGKAGLATATVTADAPWPGRGGALVGPLSLRLAAEGGARTAQPRGLAVSDVRISAILNGDVTADGGRQALRGQLQASAQGRSLTGVRAVASGLRAQLALSDLRISHDLAGASVNGRGTVDAGLDQVTAAQGRVSAVTARATFEAGADQTTAGGALRLRIAAQGRSSARAEVAPGVLRLWTAAIPTVGGEAPYREAITRALETLDVDSPAWRFELTEGRSRLSLVRPLRFAARSGARAEVTGAASAGQVGGAEGSFGLQLAGGGLPDLTIAAPRWRLFRGQGDADLSVRAAVDLKALSGGRADLGGRIAFTPTSASFTLNGCAPASAKRLAAGVESIEDLSLKLCPDGAPALAIHGGAWRLAGRVEDLGLVASGPEVALRRTAFTFEGQGDVAGGPREATVRLSDSAIFDRSAQQRFRTLALAGAANLAGGVWRADLSVADRSGHPLGTIRANMAQADGSGRLDLDTGEIAFAPGGLQPVDLSPMASAARNASGKIHFNGWFAWNGGEAPKSGGTLGLSDLGFTGPSGPVSGVDGRVIFTSLAPVVTAADQHLRVASVRTITPMTDIDIAFELTAEAVAVQAAKASFSSGRLRVEPLTVRYDATRPVETALVLDHVNLGPVLAATNLADKVKLQAVVDGRIPFQISPAGVTVRGGALSAVGGGRLSISRDALAGPPPKPGAPAAVAPAQTNIAQDFAYQALEHLAFDTLDARLDSQPNDRLGVIFHIKGKFDPPKPQSAHIAASDLLRGQALARPIKLPSDTRIDLTLDTSLNFGDLLRAAVAAWNDALAARSSTAGPPEAPAPTKGAESKGP